MEKRKILIENKIVEIDSKSYRREINAYFSYHDWGYGTSITDITVSKSKNKTIVKITTHWPGLLIGKAGVFINGLSDWLTEAFKKETIKIEIKECELWMDLY